MTDWPRVTVQQLQAQKRVRKLVAIILSAGALFVAAGMIVAGFSFVEIALVSVSLSILAELVEMNANLIGRG